METNTETFTITSSICANCGTEVLTDEETGARVHRDVTYDAKCREIRATRLAVLRSIEETGNAANYQEYLDA